MGGWTGSTLTLNKSIYLKTVLQSSGKVKLATGDPLAYDLPSTNDGYLYIYLGKTYSNYQIDLDHKHPVYYHDGTSLRQYVKPDLATTSFPGLMSASDKSKLNGIAANANNYSLPIATTTTLGGIKVGNNLSISNGFLNAEAAAYNNATTTAAGLMSASDKSKLDGISSNAGTVSAIYYGDDEALEFLFSEGSVTTSYSSQIENLSFIFIKG